MNRRSRLSGFRLMSGAGALVAGIAFFAVPAQAGYANTSCSDCYVVTPVTAPATAGAGTGQDYAFQVTNNDPHETLKQPDLHRARGFRHHRCLRPERDLGLGGARFLGHAELAS